MRVALKSLIFLIVIPGTMLGLIPAWILSTYPHTLRFSLGPLSYAGLLPGCLGLATLLWCVWDFTFTGKGTPAPIDPPKTLVVKGLYRYSRNPMYVGVLLVLLGEACFFGSFPILLFACVLFLLFQAFVVLYEERVLAKKFGDSYRTYMRGTPRWLIRIQKR